MVNDRQEFASKVQDNVAPDLAKMGQKSSPLRFNPSLMKGESSTNLRIENVETIKKDALIAKAKSRT